MKRGDSPHFLKFRAKLWNWFGQSYGVEYSVIRGQNGQPYMSRWILYVHGRTLRLHKFWQGDDDRAPHDHPWNFWTFPLTSYTEQVFARPLTNLTRYRVVEAFRWHARPASYQHIVIGRTDDKWRPFWTIVVTGPLQHGWGFWSRDRFIPWRDWR
ncbi:MAG TPA: hypothetical protein VFA39_15490 [Steroidobacteraceae bacterium]|nr:hypothetical protein [Steroidobacteraceae bacterium]